MQSEAITGQTMSTPHWPSATTWPAIGMTKAELPWLDEHKVTLVRGSGHSRKAELSSLKPRAMACGS